MLLLRRPSHPVTPRHTPSHPVTPRHTPSHPKENRSHPVVRPLIKVSLGAASNGRTRYSCPWPSRKRRRNTAASATRCRGRWGPDPALPSPLWGSCPARTRHELIRAPRPPPVGGWVILKGLNRRQNEGTKNFLFHILSRVRLGDGWVSPQQPTQGVQDIAGFPSFLKIWVSESLNRGGLQINTQKLIYSYFVPHWNSKNLWILRLLFIFGSGFLAICVPQLINLAIKKPLCAKEETQ